MVKCGILLMGLPVIALTCLRVYITCTWTKLWQSVDLTFLTTHIITFHTSTYSTLMTHQSMSTSNGETLRAAWNVSRLSLITEQISSITGQHGRRCDGGTSDMVGRAGEVTSDAISSRAIFWEPWRLHICAGQFNRGRSSSCWSWGLHTTVSMQSVGLELGVPLCKVRSDMSIRWTSPLPSPVPHDCKLSLFVLWSKRWTAKHRVWSHSWHFTGSCTESVIIWML